MRALTISLVLAAGVNAPAMAQNNCLEQIKFPGVGRWAEYKALYNKKDPYTVRYAVIGTEQRGGKPLEWVELRMTGDNKERNMVYQMLVPGSLMQMGEVEEIVFKAGDKPAMKMNGMMMKMIRGQMEKQNLYSEVCKDVTLVGKEQVTVPAGRFQAQHYHSAKYGADSWISPAVPFSLIKSVGENHRMELTSQGSGAKSSITEKPQEMPGMGGPS
jgi:alpha-L-arabinofuranosidase